MVLKSNRKMYCDRHVRRLTARFYSPPVDVAMAIEGPDLAEEGPLNDLADLATITVGEEEIADQDGGEGDEFYPEDMVEFNDMVNVYSDDEEDSDVEDELTEIEELTMKLRVWVADTNQTIMAVDKLLHVLADIPALCRLPRTHKTLMKTPKVPVTIRQVQPGNYAHFGIQAFMLTVTCKSVLEQDTVFMIMGTDGTPLAESSGLTAWPILGYICDSNVPVFVIGNYCGPKKPASACDFLKDYAEEVKLLEAEGVLVSPDRIRKKFKVKLISADAPARAFVSGSRYYNHMHGCSKCDQVCTSAGRRRIYSSTIGNKRTDESFASRSDPDHHQSMYLRKISGRGQQAVYEPVVSALEESGHGMVSSIPIDGMHCLDQGCGKVYLNALVKQEIFGGPKTAEAVLRMKNEFAKYHHYTPSEFARKSRTLDDVLHFKATEVRQFLLYTGIVILIDYLSPEAYAHFLKLSIAYRLLSTKIGPENLQLAREFLEEFVAEFTTFLEKEFLRYNVHSLLHLADDVELHGPLTSYSCYKFEDKIRHIKRMIRSNTKVNEQLFNRIQERQLINHTPKTKPRNVLTIRGTDRDGCLILWDGSVVEVFEVCRSTGQYKVLRYGSVQHLFMDPFPSGDLCIYLLSDLQPTIELVEHSSVRFKCYRLPYHSSYAAIPLIQDDMQLSVRTNS